MRTFIGDDRGGSALDMALVLPTYLLMVLGVIGMGFLLWAENAIQTAVQQAARCASVNKNDCGTATQVQNAAIGWTYGILTSNDTSKVSVNFRAICSSGQGGTAVKIQYPVNFFVLSTTVAAEACYPDLS